MATNQNTNFVYWAQQIAFYTRVIDTLGLESDGKYSDHARSVAVSRTGFGTPTGRVELVMTHKHPTESVWDSSTLDGVNVGNRCGAAAALARRITDELTENATRLGIAMTR